MQNDKRLATYLIVILGLSILVFFTRGAYADLQVQLSEKKQYEGEDINFSISAAKAESERLNDIQKKMQDPESEISKEIEKFVINFDEHELLDYFYGSAEASWGEFTIKSLTLTTREMNEYGFKEWLINLEVSVTSEKVIMDFIRDILSENAKYRFFIESFDLPEQREGSNLEISLPLKIFYK